ncbi:hypothetical protein ACOMHN_000352 [Nucella lapillus]
MLNKSNEARPSRANLQNLIKVPLQSSDLPNQLCVCLFNAKSVGVARKRTAIADFLADNDVDVMVLTETWLRESGDESKIADLTPPGYKLFSFPRQLTASIKDKSLISTRHYVSGGCNSGALPRGIVQSRTICDR